MPAQTLYSAYAVPYELVDQPMSVLTVGQLTALVTWILQNSVNMRDNTRLRSDLTPLSVRQQEQLCRTYYGRPPPGFSEFMEVTHTSHSYPLTLSQCE